MPEQNAEAHTSRWLSPRLRGTLEPYVKAFARLGPPVYLGALPAVVLVIALGSAVSGDGLAVDFHHELYPESKVVLRGENPYSDVSDRAELEDGTSQIWPIVAALSVAPLTLLPPGAADTAMTGVVLACLVATLLLLGVRDWRVLGATLLWPPIINAIQTGNLTLPLCLLTAAAWRWRGTRYVPGLAIGTALALKFFLWPLCLWLLALRRYASAAVAVVITLVSVVLIEPYGGIRDYVDVVRVLSDIFEEHSYSVYALLADAGVGPTAARIVNTAVGCALLVLAWRRRSLPAALAAALVLSPIVWLHFFALLLVPVAIVRPRFGALWLAPLAMWFAPGTGNGSTWQTALVLTTAGVVLLACERATLRGSAV